MSTSRMARIDDSMERLEHVIDQRLRREEEAEAEDARAREVARRQRQRDNADQRRQIGAVYADAFASFGVEVPAPADDEAPARYRVRLFNRLARKLAPSHELADVRADDLGGQPVVMDNFERMIIEAAKAEGEKPSFDNLPSDGSLISRTRVADTGEKSVDYYGRRSFIADLSRPAHRVVRVCDPKTQNILIGRAARPDALMARLLRRRTVFEACRREGLDAARSAQGQCRAAAAPASSQGRCAGHSASRRRQLAARQPPATCHSDQTGAEIMDTTFTINGGTVGQVLPVVDGYLQAFNMTKAPWVYDAPVFKPNGAGWQNGYFSLVGERDRAILVQFELSNPMRNAASLNIGYHGGLLVACVPRGSEWTVTVSDVPAPLKAA